MLKIYDDDKNMEIATNMCMATTEDGKPRFTTDDLTEIAKYILAYISIHK